MQPKIGKIIYITYDQDIYKLKVYMKGTESFIAKEIMFTVNDTYYERLYSDYNRVWFTSLKDAKQSIIDTYTNDKVDHIEFEKHNDCHWEAFVYDKQGVK